MVVMILESVPPGLRGELSRWLIEPKTGIYVGHISARVREKLWEKCVKNRRTGGIIQIWTTNTEQRFGIKMEGDTSRILQVEEGIQLIKIPGENNKTKRIKSTKSR